MVYKDTAKEAERQQAIKYNTNSGEPVDNIGVSLMENGNKVSARDYGGSDAPTVGILLTGIVGERREVSTWKKVSRRNCSAQFRRNRNIL